MGSRLLVVLLILVLLASLAALNWSAFTTRVPLSLLVTRVEAPLGLLMLGVVAALTLLYLVFAAAVETRALLEGRRHTRELDAERKRADEAETSRYTELRKYLEAELAALRTLTGDSAREAIARVEQAEGAIKDEVERAGNTLAAYIGELEDRLTRPSQEGPAPPA
jgi:uncharacterized integral membrane protein